MKIRRFKQNKTKTSGFLKFALLALAIFVFLFVSGHHIFSRQAAVSNHLVYGSPTPTQDVPHSRDNPSEKSPKSQTLAASSLKNAGVSLKVPIVTYHYVREGVNPKDKIGIDLSVPPAVFEQQMSWLSTNGYQTITLDNLAAAFDKKFTMPQKPVILTFDDSNLDTYTAAYPVLQKYHLRASLLIVTDFLDTPWHMSWGQLEEMVDSGQVEVVAHTRTHPYLVKVDDKRLVEEVAGSKAILEGRLGRKINWFGYPYGSGALSSRVQAVVRKAGYVGAVSTLPGINQYQTEIYGLKRLMGRNMTNAQFEKLLTTPLAQIN